MHVGPFYGTHVYIHIDDVCVDRGCVPNRNRAKLDQDWTKMKQEETKMAQKEPDGKETGPRWGKAGARRGQDGQDGY